MDSGFLPIAGDLGGPIPYSSYKESEVQWLGEVPEHWQLNRIADIADLRVSNVDKHINQDEIPVRLCNYVDVYYNDRINSHIKFMSSTASSSEIARFRLAIGDVLVTKDSEDWVDIGIPALVEYAAEDLLCGYHLAVLRPNPDFVHGAYLFHCLRSSRIAWQLSIAASGVTRYGLSRNAIRSLRIPRPTLHEQSAITRFLDHTDQRIQRYISAKEKLIELLEEQKQAVIHEAVTGKIDVRTGKPYQSYKDSGVDWLGDVPEHWAVQRLLNSVFDCANGVWGDDPNGTDDLACVRVADFDRQRLSVRKRIPTVRAVTPSLRRGRMLQQGDLLLEKSGGGDQQLVGAVVLFDEDVPAVCSNFIARMRVRKDFDTSYLKFLHSLLYAIRLNARSIKQTTGIQNLDQNAYFNERVAFPPLKEQFAIARFLNDLAASSSSAIAIAKTQINLVREYRTRLIADVVTGKLDVRKVAARLPEIDELEASEDQQEQWQRIAAHSDAAAASTR